MLQFSAAIFGQKSCLTNDNFDMTAKPRIDQPIPPFSMVQGQKKMKKILASFVCMLPLLIGCTPKVESGVSAYEAKQYSVAREVFEKNSADPVALYYLYKIYSNGDGVTADERRGREYLTKAAEKGYAKAQENLADKYFNGYGVEKNLNEASRLYSAAAAQGLKSAYVGLGDYYAHENGGNDKKKAFEYYLSAEGTAIGDWTLGRLYESGLDGEPEAPEKAFKYYQATTKHDQEKWIAQSARFDLAELFYYGYGVSQDAGEALKLVKTVTDSEIDFLAEKASAFYAWLLFWGHGTNENPKEAVRIWESQIKAAIKKNTDNSKVYVDAHTLYGLLIAHKDRKGEPHDPAIVEFVKQIVANPMPPGDLIQVKYQALGYGINDCGHSVSVSPRSHGRYRKLKGETYLAMAECHLKDAKSYRTDAYYFALRAGEFGEVKGTTLAREIYTMMSPAERESVRAVDAMGKRLDLAIRNLELQRSVNGK